MASMMYTPLKRALNDNGNPSWDYKDEDSIYNVLNYILDPPVPLVHAGAMGVPINDINAMMAAFLSTQYLWKKTDGRPIRHEVLGIDTSDNISNNAILIPIAYSCDSYYWKQGFQVVFAVWGSDKDHIRNLPEIHFVINTVALPDGHKYTSNHDSRICQNIDFQNIVDYFTGSYAFAMNTIFDEPDYSDFLYCPMFTDFAVKK